MQPVVEYARPELAGVTDMTPMTQMAAQTCEAPVTVAAVGVEEHMLAAISLFFQIRLGSRYALGDPQDADVWFFDVDKMDGRSEWDRHRRERAGIPAVVLSIREIDLEEVENAVFAMKPLRVALLTEILKQLAPSPAAKTAGLPAQADRETAIGDAPSNATEFSGEPPMRTDAESASVRNGIMSDGVESDTEQSTFLADSHWYQDTVLVEDTPETASPGSDAAAVAPKSRRSPPNVHEAARKLGESHQQLFIGSMPDIDATSPQELQTARFDPSRFLVGAVSRATAMAAHARMPVRVSGRDWSILIRPDSRRSWVDIRKGRLRSMAMVPLAEEVGIQVLTGMDAGETLGGVKWRLSALQWTLMLMAARGRIPLGTDPGAKVKLKQWPNLTRLQTFPHAMRIASLWSRRPISLLESATVLGIPQRYVFAFFSAVQVLGLVETLDAGKADQGCPDDRPVARHRSLFRKILAHLGLG